MNDELTADNFARQIDLVAEHSTAESTADNEAQHIDFTHDKSHEDLKAHIALDGDKSHYRRPKLKYANGTNGIQIARRLALRESAFLRELYGLSMQIIQNIEKKHEMTST